MWLTNLKTILNDKIANDNAFLNALKTACSSSTDPAMAVFASSIDSFITQNTQINNSINSLLK